MLYTSEMQAALADTSSRSAHVGALDSERQWSWGAVRDITRLAFRAAALSHGEWLTRSFPRAAPEAIGGGPRSRSMSQCTRLASMRRFLQAAVVCQMSVSVASFFYTDRGVMPV